MLILMLTNSKVGWGILLMLSSEDDGWLSLTSDAYADADYLKSGMGDPGDALR